MFRLALVAMGLGLSNLAAAIGIGLSGVDARVRLRVGIVFGAFEATMPMLGLLIGRRVATFAGSASAVLGGGILIGAGVYAVVRARTGGPGHAAGPMRAGPLIATGAALSVDNLVVGFGLGAQRVPLALTASVIAVASVAMSLAGLELGLRLGRAVEKRSEEIGGVVLVLVGVAIATGLL